MSRKTFFVRERWLDNEMLQLIVHDEIETAREQNSKSTTKSCIQNIKRNKSVKNADSVYT